MAYERIEEIAVLRCVPKNTFNPEEADQVPFTQETEQFHVAVGINAPRGINRDHDYSFLSFSYTVDSRYIAAKFLEIYRAFSFSHLRELR